MIHPSAVIAKNAEIHETTDIGPFCIIGDGVKIGENNNLISHVSIVGDTTIENSNTFYPFCSIGSEPQDLKYNKEKSYLKIGSNNKFRENVTVNPGTSGGGLNTIIADNCLFMVGSHVAHDCMVGDNVILANNATLGGHVIVGDWAILGGLVGVHQFCRIGRHAMVGAHSMVVQDVLPYTTVAGPRAHLAGLNLVGLKRHDFDREAINQLRDALDALFAEPGTVERRLDEVSQLLPDHGPAEDVLRFITQATRGRGFTGPLE